MNSCIVYEDDEILLLNKPAGIVVNRADTTRHMLTVQDWFEGKTGISYSEGDVDPTDFYKRGGVVHRLDKETSGILILAKTETAFIKLQEQFKERTVKKIYRAFAHGEIKLREGEIHAPVGRLPWNRTRFGILPDGRESVTRYKVLSYHFNRTKKERLTYVELYPQSGRTHQIRVHLKHINHPIFADFLYAGRKTSRDDRKVLDRVFLHAAAISFVHPRSGEFVSFESSLPTELQKCIDLFPQISSTTE